MTHKVRPRAGGTLSSRPGTEQIEQSLKDLASYTVELKEVMQELFLAIASKVEVIPVWIEGTYEAIPPGASYVRPGVVTLRFGTPVPTAWLDYDDRDELTEQVHAQIVGLAGDSPYVRFDPVAVPR